MVIDGPAAVGLILFGAIATSSLLDEIEKLALSRNRAIFVVSSIFPHLSKPLVKVALTGEAFSRTLLERNAFGFALRRFVSDAQSPSFFLFFFFLLR